MEHVHAAALVEGSLRLGVSLEAGQVEQLLAHLDLLQRWNRTHNLVGPGSPEQWLERHTLDSLAAARFLPSGKGIDVGSGAGFPGIPLAVVRPDCQFTLAEPREKRAAFLANAIATLGLRRAMVVREHLEPGASPGDAQFAISRATLPLPEWLPLAASLLAPAGVAVGFLGLESWDPRAVEAEAKRAGLESARLESYQIGAQPVRTLAIFRRP